MCLDIKRSDEAIIASEDIICYKALLNRGYGLENLVTYYQGSEVKIGETYVSELVKSGSSIEIGLHSFAKLNGIKNFRKDSCRSFKSIFVAECIIPKGSSYFIGKFEMDCGYTSYASDCLKYVKIIKL